MFKSFQPFKTFNPPLYLSPVSRGRIKEGAQRLERLEPLERHPPDLRKQFASPGVGLAVPAGLKTTKIIPRSLGATLQRDLRAEGAALLRTDRADLSQRYGLQGFLGVIFKD